MGHDAVNSAPSTAPARATAAEMPMLHFFVQVRYYEAGAWASTGELAASAHTPLLAVPCASAAS